MFCCNVCQSNLTIICGFGVCGCGVEPLQKVISRLSPQPDDYIHFLNQHKLLSLKKSERALAYMEKASKLIRGSKYGKFVRAIPDDKLPWIAGCGSFKSFAAWMKGEDCEIDPRNLIIVKSVPNYVTGIWLIGRKRSRLISWHPFGLAFFHLLFNQPIQDFPILLFQNLKTALKLVNWNYENSLPTPFLAHPDLSISGLHLWLNREIIVVIDNEEETVLSKLAKNGLPYVISNNLHSMHAPTLCKQAKLAKKIPKRTTTIISLPKLPPIVVDSSSKVWRHARNGNILGHVPFVLEGIAQYGLEEIYFGYVEQNGRKFDVGFDDKTIAYRWLEFVCRSLNIPISLNKKLRASITTILAQLYEGQIQTTTKPLFGYFPETQEIILPYVTFSNELIQNYFYLHDYPLTWVPISALSNIKHLSLRFSAFVRWLKNLFESVFENRGEIFNIYAPQKQYAEKVLAKFWITKLRADHKNWPTLDIHIKIIEAESPKKDGIFLRDFPISIPPFDLRSLIF